MRYIIRIQIYVLMMLLTLGIAGIFIDLFFVFPGFAAGKGPPGGLPAEAKMSSQGGVNQRMNLFRQKPGRIRKLPPPM